MESEREALIEETAEALCTADDYIYGLLTPDEADHYRKYATVAIDTIVPHIAAEMRKAMWGTSDV